MNESDPDDKPRLSSEEVEAHVQHELERAQRLTERLVTEGEPGETHNLYLGIEGGPTSERVVREILTQAGLTDLRETEPRPLPADDQQAEAVFEVRTDRGIAFRLTRVRLDDSPAKLLDLEAEKI